MDREEINKKITSILKNNWRIIFEGLLILVLSFFVYGYITRPVKEISGKEEILEQYKEDRKQSQETLKQIKSTIDSIHIEQKYTQQRIDGTLEAIKKIDKKKNEKINTIRNSPIDTTISFLSNRYN